MYYYLKDAIKCDKCFFDDLHFRYFYRLTELDTIIHEAMEAHVTSIPVWINSKLTYDYAEWMEIFEFFDGNGLTYEYKNGEICRAHFNLPAATSVPIDCVES